MAIARLCRLPKQELLATVGSANFFNYYNFRTCETSIKKNYSYEIP